MKMANHFKFILLAFLILNVHSTVLNIEWVSTSPKSSTSAMGGSIMGGTVLYIKMTGHSPDPKSNKVVLRKQSSTIQYPCQIANDGVTDVSISCLTSALPNFASVDKLDSLVVYVESTDEYGAATVVSLPATTKGSTFTYQRDIYTPVIYDVFPAVAVGNTRLNYYGIHRISNIGDEARSFGDIYGINIGQEICNVIGVKQFSDGVETLAINPNSLESIACDSSYLQQAGKYLVSEHVTPGYSLAFFKLQRTSLLQQNYNFVVLPNITSISPKEGAVGGQIVTIIGSGFSTNNDDNKVSIDQTPCIPTVSTSTQIKCVVSPKQIDQDSTLSTNKPAGSQINGYESGSGFFYTRYDITNLATKSALGLKLEIDKGSTTLPIFEKGFRGQIKTGRYHGSYYGQVFKGYFKAPKTGNYTFRGVADDSFQIYLSTDYGTTSNPPTLNLSNLIAYSNSHQDIKDIYLNDYPTAQSSPIELQAGRSYYMEVYHVNNVGNGELSVSVEVPNSDNTLSWQTHATQFYKFDLTNDPQVLRFNLTNIASGTILLQRIQTNSSNMEIIFQKNVTINYNATATQFCDALNQFPFYSGYGLSCQLKMYDENDTQTSNQSITRTFTWIVTIQKFRPASQTSKRFNANQYNGADTGLLQSHQTLKQHSPLMSGTFRVKIGDIDIKYWGSLDFPFDAWDGSLQAGLRQLKINEVDFSKVQVYRQGEPKDGSKWVISYVGANYDIPELTFDTQNLVGGKLGTKPTVTFTNRRSYSSNLLFNPIDYQFMSTYSDKPNVIVQVNGINSVCLNDCTYTFDDNVPQISSIDLNSNILAITLTDPNSANIALDAISVQFDSQKCQILTGGSMTAFSCSLPLNQDGVTPKLAAGDYFPIVYINTIGFIQPMSNVSQISIPMTISTVSPSSTTNNGGRTITINGNGFSTDPADITVTVNGIQTEILSVTNTQITVVSPTTDSTTTVPVVINSRTKDASNSITLSTPATVAQIHSISPTSASPVLKAIMNITGSGFGTDSSLVKVYLTNSTGNIYQMRIIEISENFIKCGIPGGLPGNFFVTVNIDGLGNAIANPVGANLFKYQAVITGVTPTTGSSFGGTLLTITGRNFVPNKMESLVFIGNQLNQFCYIEAISTSTITCRTIYNTQYAKDTPQVITLTSRLIIDNTCQGSCSFSYIDQTLSPYLSSMVPTSITTGNVVLTGQRFDLGTSCKVSLINNKTNQITIVTPTQCIATRITFSIPTSIQAGFYYVTSQNDPIGQSNPLILQVNMFLASPTSSTISKNGAQITFAGNGLPATWPNTHYNLLTLTSNSKNQQLKIISTSTTSLVLEVPAAGSGTSYTFKIVSPTLNTISKSFSQQTSSTPQVTLTSSIQGPSGPFSVSLNRSRLATVQPQIVKIYATNNPQFMIDVPNWTYLGTLINFSVTLNSGKYGFKLYDSLYGWYDTNRFITVANAGGYSVSSTVSSFNGGSFTVSGANISRAASIKVQGRVGKYLHGDSSSATFQVPALITPLSQDTLKLASASKLDLSKYTLWGDSKEWQSAFDMKQETSYESNNSLCSIGIDIGQDLGVSLTRIRYFPTTAWVIASNFIQGALFQVSNDNSTWTTISTIDSLVHAGWNIIMPENKAPYRYVRFSHDSTSKCRLAEFQISGIVMNSVSVTSLTSHLSDVVFNDGSYTQTWTDSIQYKLVKTPVVNSVSPKNGNVFGNYALTLTGVYLNLATPTVTIDGEQCVLISNTETQIVCNVSSRLDLPAENSFTVYIGQTPSIIKESFRYVMRWSDITTWGADLPPIDDDLVYVPAGMHLLVDQSTPLLNGIIVHGGTLQFADEADMIIRAGYITLVGGQFIAGTQDSPYQNKLTFIMYGNYYGIHQPMFGNKGIGCKNCKFSMYGQKRTPTWTLLNSTVNKDQNQLTVMEDVDWRAGQQIVIASTSYDHNEAERFKILSITGRRITIDGKFKNQHYADVQNYGTDSITMRAQVGLLTRNIKMMGDDTSVASDYGSHLMLTGTAQNGFVGHVAYTQFTKCGQPQIVGRYCMHFHMAGEVSQSYAIGNAVHDSMARVITIHGVHYLHVAWNVGYRVHGHNFFLQDGIQTNNLIQHNLAIGSLSAFNMMQTDVSVASFWITNPFNHVRYNHAAGGDFYGFWYQIKPNPDGPSATLDICPVGNPLGSVHDNVAHSNVRFGLRILELNSRQNPCLPIRNDELDDPWSQNPSIEAKFSNFTLFKNGESGLLAEKTGHTIFQNFTIAESLLAGVEFYFNNQTKQYVRLINSVIIGQSSGNGPSSPSQLTGSKGVIGPRTGVLQMQNVSFYDFPPVMTVFQSCSKCDEVKLYTNTGQQSLFKGIKYSNILGKYLFMKGLKRQMIYDLDGSFSKNFDATVRSSATIVSNWKHIAAQSACKPAQTPSSWDNALACDQTITIRKVVFTNLLNENQFKSIPMKVQLISSPDVVVDINSTTSDQIYSLHFGSNKQPKKQKKFSFALPYVTNRVYNIWWKTGIDFTHLAMHNSPLFTPTDKAILFKFKYTQNRELFQIATLKDIKASTSANPVVYNTKNTDYPNANTCANGQYYHNNDVDKSMLVLCSSGKGKANPFEYIDVNGIKCRYLCPKPAGQFVKQNFVRLWSNETQWPGGVMPVDGQNVTVNGNWTVMMDVNPAIAPLLTIDGDVIIDNKDINITAKSIWIRAGSLVAGSAGQPFPHKLTIQINGQKQDRGIVIDPFQAGNKLFAITGTLNLYGKAPATTWTKLSAYARTGHTSITVLSAAGWKVGDQIVISPSFSSPTQKQKVTITAINSNTVTFTPALKFDHFGASTTTITTSYGSLDTRAGVGHLTRNIKIVSGPNYTWGYRVLVYGYKDTNDFIRTGDVILSGVQFTMGGQFDTEKSTLDINNIRAGATPSIITKSSFHQCQSFCMNIDNVAIFDINNNVFYDAKLFHTRALNLYSFYFRNNLMTGVSKREEVPFDQMVACFASYDQFDVLEQNVSVSDNLCQGSGGIGYALTLVQCSLIDSYPFVNNIAGSTSIGYLLNGVTGNCQAATNLMAYASKIGQLCNPAGLSQLKFSKFIMADNQRSITLRVGGGSDFKTAFVTDSYVTAISRPSCTDCYGNGKIDCSGNHAMRMMAIGSNSQKMPSKFSSGFDVICKEETFDGKAFLYNTVFDSFRGSYSGLSQCSNNVVFIPHPGSTDITGSHHLFNTSCPNCDSDSYGFFPPPDKNQLGWFGGCGTILCTGMNNYIVQDHTGNFFNFKGTLLANNSWIGDNTAGCVKSQKMNGHLCTRQDFGVLQYQSLAPDFNRRQMWPVYLRFDGGTWTSQTNAWIEWEWLGGEPLNARRGRFVSTVQLQQVYNVTMAAMPPIDMRYRIQRRVPEGKDSDWLVIKMYYPMPNSIAVSVNGRAIKPISLLDNNGQNPLDTSVCGSNKFFYKNYTIHFVVTGSANCQVRVRLTNSIQLTSRFTMDINDFFANGGQTLFIDRMCAVLQINDTSRLKIVGILRGSVVIDAVLEAPLSNQADGPELNQTQQQASLLETQNLLNKVAADGSLHSALAAGGSLGPLASIKSKMTLLITSDDSKQDNTGMIIGIVLGITVGICFVVVGTICYIRKRAKITQLGNELPMYSQGQKSNQMGNNNKVISDQNFSIVSFDSKKGKMDN